MREPPPRRCQKCRATGARLGLGRGSQPPSCASRKTRRSFVGARHRRRWWFTGQSKHYVRTVSYRVTQKRRFVNEAFADVGDRKTKTFDAAYARATREKKSREILRFGVLAKRSLWLANCGTGPEKSAREPVFFLSGGNRGRGGSRTFPTAAGERLDKSRRWSSWTWSWPWPASRGRLGRKARVRGGDLGQIKHEANPHYEDPGLRPVTLARAKSFLSERTRDGSRGRRGFRAGKTRKERMAERLGSRGTPFPRRAFRASPKQKKRLGQERTSSSSTSSSDSTSFTGTLCAGTLPCTAVAMFLVLSRAAGSRLGQICEGVWALAGGAVPVARRERTPEPRAMRASDAPTRFFILRWVSTHKIFRAQFSVSQCSTWGRKGIQFCGFAESAKFALFALRHFAVEDGRAF